MSLIAFIMALFQMSGSELQGNAWWDRALDLTLANLHSIQGFFGWVALVAVIAIVVMVLISMLTGRGAGAVFTVSSCLVMGAVASIVIWLVGWLHILAVGYLAANFTAAQGALNPGFWALLIIMICVSWS